ncbi:MAG: alpha/beta fold hydrolase [Candidatus Methylomirabilia bacterium]
MSTGHDRRITLRGLRFHYLEWGAETSPPLVLLHGITGHAHVWDDFAQEMAPFFRVLSLDQRGHGDSDASPEANYHLAALVADLVAFVDALGLPRFVLLGLSLGGRVGICYAADHPEHVSRLVVVDIGPEIHLPGLLRVRTMMASAPEMIPSEDWAFEYLKAGNPRYRDAQLRNRVRHGLKRLPDGTLTWKYSGRIRDMVRNGIHDTSDLWQPLARVAIPTLVIRGAESDILAAEVARKMVETLPDGRLVEVAEAGHTVPGDQPEAFVQAVREFLLNPSEGG